MTTQNQNYNCTFTVPETPAEVFNAICRVQHWWTANLTVQASEKNDVFTVRFAETWVSFLVTEMVRNKRIVWQVTDSHLHWLNDKKEWNSTELIFDIKETNEGTQMSLTHVGIKPGIECYENCRKGWDFYAGSTLRKLIMDKKGIPDTKQSERQQ